MQKYTVADDHYYPRDPSRQSSSSGELHVDPSKHDDEHHFHVLSLPLLCGVLAILLFLTFVTVAVTWVDLGALNIWVALAIAVVKAVFVALYFMHLRWDSVFNAFVFTTALIFLALFIGVTLMDSAAYQVNYEPPGGTQVTATPDAAPVQGR